MDSIWIYPWPLLHYNLWILRQVSERAIEFNAPIYCALVDYKGAFDALNRVTLGRVLKLFLSPSMVKRVLSLYFEAKAIVVRMERQDQSLTCYAVSGRGAQHHLIFPLSFISST